MPVRFWPALLILGGLAAAADKPDLPLRRASLARESSLRAGKRTTKKSGTERVLLLLVEFGGPDTVEFIPTGPNRSTWDPIGKADTSEYTGTPGDCSAIVRKYGITGPTRYTYSGPPHNRIERPRSASDTSGTMIWSEDFSPDYYRALATGGGYRYRYRRQDSSEVDQDAAGNSVAAYYRDASLGALGVEVEVVGWLQVPHSLYWYGADPCPGRLSGSPSMEDQGAIPGSGGIRGLLIDAVEAARKARPDLDWTSFDKDKDGFIDHLWIVHAGLGEEDGATLLGRTEYGEGTLWSSSASVGKPVDVVPGLQATQVILLKENAGAAVLAHEFAHRLGADDLYNLAGSGEPSTGVWTLMSDTWTGVPSGSATQAFDPWHLDFWGWLDPLVITDPAREYAVNIGQTSRFPGGDGVYRGVRIDLPAGTAALPAKPSQSWYWWGGQRDATDSLMTLARPVKVPAGSTLRFSLAYSIEEGWDFLFVQASDDGGRNWKILTNTATTCKTAAGWMGAASGLPEDLCAAGAGGFTGRGDGFPALSRQSFDLSAYADKEILLRFWYFTDTAWTEDGPFLDDISIGAGLQTAFSDGAESAESNWTFTGDFRRSDGTLTYPQSYYLQWRNTGPDGGFDSTLARPDWTPGPMATGLLVWYSNGRYTSNNIRRSLLDPPAFGPKGRLLVVNARPEPYRDPDLVARGYNNEAANISERSQLRGAPFSLQPSPAFAATLSDRTLSFDGKPAVPRFRDGSGYLPGLEFTSPGPRSTGGDRWMTRRWNTGVVLPSRTPYGVKGAGYRAGTPILFNCSANPAQGTSSCESANASLDGGSGDPADSGGHYGWNVEILEQSATGAKLRIWNELGK
jgi:immune inhibitor A